MSTPTTAIPAAARRAAGRRNLQSLRIAAGYRSAREFADAMGIPASTYSRYESQPADPTSRIPLGAAWRLADALGCTIDLVVGRARLDEPADGLRAAYDALSEGSRRLLDDYLGYLQCRDGRPAPARGW